MPGRRYVVKLAGSGRRLLEGYNRVVYGDGGPYVEFEGSMLVQEVRMVDRSAEQYRYYDTWFTACGVKLYCQRRTVVGKPNPPQTGKYCCNNNRVGGYADYRVGKWYVAADEVVVENS